MDIQIQNIAAPWQRGAGQVGAGRTAIYHSWRVSSTLVCIEPCGLLCQLCCLWDACTYKIPAVKHTRTFLYRYRKVTARLHGDRLHSAVCVHEEQSLRGKDGFVQVPHPSEYALRGLASPVFQDPYHDVQVENTYIRTAKKAMAHAANDRTPSCTVDYI